MNIAIILAGGVGKRFGADKPKQFVEVFNKPIIAYTLELFQQNQEIDAIEIVCHKDWVNETNRIVSHYGITKTRWITSGGDTFQDSVCKGVQNLRDHCTDDDIVMIHMSVAPMIGDDIIQDGLRVCREKGNSISVNPCFLCMGTRDNDEYSSKSVLRETLIGLNTPQTFRYGDIYTAYTEAINGGYLDNLEPHITSLMYERGVKLYFSKGSQMNIKITERDDLKLFEAYCIMKQNKEIDKNKEQ